MSVTACGARVEDKDAALQAVDGRAGDDDGTIDESVEQRLRRDLDGTDLCSSRDDFLRFEEAAGLAPAVSQDYIEWRQLTYPSGSRESVVESLERTKRALIEDISLSDEEREQQLIAVLAQYMNRVSEDGHCALASGCDRYILGSEEGFPESAWSGIFGYYQLLGLGAAGPTFVTNRDEMLAFLGAIDTPHEAALMAKIDGYGVGCDGPVYATEDDAFLLYAKRGNGCGVGEDIVGYRLRVGSDGSIEVLESQVVEATEVNCTIGRLPSGAVAKRCRGKSEHPVGRYFADVARLEAASILAFRELARDLKHHGAPHELVAWAERAAAEETEHALSCRALARRYGVNLEPVGVNPSATRGLLDIAIDNAREGLTREAFGALLAHHQLRMAKDPAVRAALSRIARDETSHAEFSIALHRWLQTRLNDAERASVEAARVQARSEFGATLHAPYAEEVVTLAGMPTPEVSQALFAQLFAEDWAA